MSKTSNPSQRWWQNPIAVRELRARMRGKRALMGVSLYCLGLSLIISLIYLSFANNLNNPYGPDPRDAGRAIYTFLLVIQSFLVLFISPTLTAGAITGEKEQQTYDILRTTLLSAPQLVRGKLMAPLSYVLILLLITMPLQSVAFVLGGIELRELLLTQLILLVGAITISSMALFYSSIMRSTLAATVASLATLFIVLGGIPGMILIGGSIAGVFFYTLTPPGWTVMVGLIYAGLVLAGTNMPATLIITETFLLSEGSLFMFQTNIDGHLVWVIAPWLFFFVLQPLLALLFYKLTVRRVRKIAK